MTRLSKFAILGLATILLGGLNGLINPSRPSWSEKTLQEGEIRLRDRRLTEGVIWVDARSADEFAKDHIPGALLLNESNWDALFPDFLDAWQPGERVVVYCSSLSCQASNEVAERLREEAGFEEIYVLKGGWEAWQAAQK